MSIQAKFLTLEQSLILPSPVQPLSITSLQAKHISIDIKRDDLIHPVISGNKWRKLKQTIYKALAENCQHIVSFGGGHSNHLHALAYVCHILNIKFTAIIRGDYSANPTPTIVDLMNWQCHIQYVSKIEYKQRNVPRYLAQLSELHKGAWIVPEGGSQEQALEGVGEIFNELTSDYDFIIAPVASGGTLAGLIQSTANTATQILGVAVLKGQDYLEALVEELLDNPHEYQHWHIEHGFHFGGYAKSNDALIHYCKQFEQDHGIAIEPVYSGKLMWAIEQLANRGDIPPNSRILALHTGGVRQ